MAHSITRPLKNTPFRLISVLDSTFNPRNTQCIPVVKIFALLELRGCTNSNRQRGIENKVGCFTVQCSGGRRQDAVSGVRSSQSTASRHQRSWLPVLYTDPG